jgi:hypothetical protein
MANAFLIVPNTDSNLKEMNFIQKYCDDAVSAVSDDVNL